MAATNEELLMQVRSSGIDSEIMSELWENNQGLIRMIVRNVIGLTEREDGFEDMMQQAYFGFYAAVQNYDPNSGVAFSTYAANRVKWSLYRYYEQNGHTVRIPAYMKRRIRDCAKKKLQMETEFGHSVSYPAALEAMGLSPTAVAGTLAAFQKLNTVSMESSDGLSLLDRLAAGDDVEDAVVNQEWHRELHELLFKALSELPQEDSAMIVQKYFHGVPLSKLSQSMGCSRQTLFLRQRAAFQAIRAGQYGSELAEFMPDTRTMKRAKKCVQMDREKLNQLQLSDIERGLLAL